MVKTETADLAVADAGPLIHLDELAALDVLDDYPAIWIPDAVWLEVTYHRPQVLKQTGLRLLRHTPAMPSGIVTALAPLYTLHRGEQEALALCLQHSINTLFTDDTAARLAARSLNIVTHGTLGLLIRAVRRNRRTAEEVIDLLAAVPSQTSLHIRPSLLDDVIRQVRREWNSEND